MNPLQTNAWKTLNQFSKNKIVPEPVYCQEGPIFLDVTRNSMSSEVLKALFQLAREMDLERAIQRMFAGEKINETENRAVLHVALRNLSATRMDVDGENVMPAIKQELDHMEAFTNEVIRSEFKGFSGLPITDVVNIGIGGSDLGPRMAYEALKPYHNRLNVHYVSNVDNNDLSFTLKELNPETTLFIICSKTFTTAETMTNARSAKSWLLKHYHNEEQSIARHFVAVSTNESAVQQFGISRSNIFRFWDWVGGRYSMWSVVGLSLSLGIGFQNFRQLLEGAGSMDQHFRTSRLEDNLPVILALTGIWNRNFMNANNHAVIPYNELLNLFVPYLQQLDMESNGKSVDKEGDPVDYKTGPIIWGGVGTNVQHSFFQHIHQGTDRTSLDFIGVAGNRDQTDGHYRTLLSNMLAQAQSLYDGNSAHTDFHKGKEKLKPWRTFPGGVHSNLILLDDLSPKTLGSLLAMYEHKVFVQGIIWNVFSFDQWGVELGKVNARSIQESFDDDHAQLDEVTKRALAKIKEMNHALS